MDELGYRNSHGLDCAVAVVHNETSSGATSDASTGGTFAGGAGNDTLTLNFFASLLLVGAGLVLVNRK